MKRRAPLVAAIVGVALVSLVVLFATAPSGKDADTSQSVVGKLAPQLTGTTADGSKVDLDDYRGKWVVVNFFATWCPPCVKEHPELVKFSQRDGQIAQVVSVAFDDPASKIKEFFAERGGDWPVLIDDTTASSLDYAVVKLPESFLIDPQGNVAQKLEGGITAAELDKIITSKS